jgi:hypothetical protein
MNKRACRRRGFDLALGLVLVASIAAAASQLASAQADNAWVGKRAITRFDAVLRSDDYTEAIRIAPKNASAYFLRATARPFDSIPIPPGPTLDAAPPGLKRENTTRQSATLTRQSDSNLIALDRTWDAAQRGLES